MYSPVPYCSGGSNKRVGEIEEGGGFFLGQPLINVVPNKVKWHGRVGDLSKKEILNSVKAFRKGTNTIKVKVIY